MNETADERMRRLERELGEEIPRNMNDLHSALYTERGMFEAFFGAPIRFVRKISFGRRKRQRHRGGRCAVR